MAAPVSEAGGDEAGRRVVSEEVGAPHTTILASGPQSPAARPQTRLIRTFYY